MALKNGFHNQSNKDKDKIFMWLNVCFNGYITWNEAFYSTDVVSFLLIKLIDK